MVIKLSRDAIVRAIQYTEGTIDDLQRNLNFLKSNVDPHLGQWQDKHVSRYFDTQESFDTKVNSVCGQLNDIVDSLNGLLRYMDNY